MFSASLNCALGGSAEYGDVLTFCIKINPQVLCDEIRLNITDDDTGEIKKYIAHKNENTFSVTIGTKEICGSDNGLFFISIELKTVYGRLFLCKNDSRFFLSDNVDESATHQLLVYTNGFETPDFIKGGVMYQIMVDRFFIGEKRICRAEAVNIKDWNSSIPQYPEIPGDYIENNYFYGGNLSGIVKKLPYLKELGVTVIYLCPIFEAYSNHKYDTGNYMSVDSAFGGDDALRNLVMEAQKFGIGIILDGVFNHTGDDSVYFNKKGKYASLGAYQSTKSPYYSWYFFNSHPNDYHCWWGIKILPKINTENSEFINFICENNGVIEKYMDMGIKGFRLDVADELSNIFIESLRNKVKSCNREAIVIGEVWEDASNKIAYGKRRKYFRGNQLDSVMNYPLRKGVIEFILKKDAQLLAKICRTLWYNYPRHISHTLMNFLGTHDTERIISLLSGADISSMTNKELSRFSLTEEQKEKSIEMLKIAYVLIMTLPGVPCIYYGDEVGMEGGRDPFNRMSYPWGGENREIVEWCKKIGKIRTENSIFKNGDFKMVEEMDGVFAFSRYSDEEQYFICANLSDKIYSFYIGDIVQNLITGKIEYDMVCVKKNDVVILKKNNSYVK